eukprot:3172258-Rhodomonas_salina.1
MRWLYTALFLSLLPSLGDSSYSKDIHLIQPLSTDGPCASCSVLPATVRPRSCMHSFEVRPSIAIEGISAVPQISSTSYAHDEREEEENVDTAGTEADSAEKPKARNSKTVSKPTASQVGRWNGRFLDLMR